MRKIRLGYKLKNKFSPAKLLEPKIDVGHDNFGTKISFYTTPKNKKTALKEIKKVWEKTENKHSSDRIFIPKPNEHTITLGLHNPSKGALLPLTPEQTQKFIKAIKKAKLISKKTNPQLTDPHQVKPNGEEIMLANFKPNSPHMAG